jgi:hypothetical protein
MEDKLLILQIAFSLVADSPFWNEMVIDARIEELQIAYRKLDSLMGGVAEKPVGIQ